MEDAKTKKEDENNSLSTLNSILGIEEDNNHNSSNWFFQENENNLNTLHLQPLDASSSACTPTSASIFQNLDPNQTLNFFPPKPMFFPFDHSFDLTCETGFLDMNKGTEGFNGFGDLGVSSLSSNPHFFQMPENGFGSQAFDVNSLFSTRPLLLKPLHSLDGTEGKPTLFQKRVALRRNTQNSEGEVTFDDSDSGDLIEYNNIKVEEDGIKIDGDGNISNANSDRKGKKRGLPAKNLLAERRRRKKLNDKLLLLRSVVPKITKMDKTSILIDAINYVKELLQKINELQTEVDSTPSSSLVNPTPTPSPTASACLYPLTPTSATPSSHTNYLLPSPTSQPAKIELWKGDGRAMEIHMLCNKRDNMLLSISNAFDKLGLDIQQATISCFNSFVLDVFLAEYKEGEVIVPDQIKSVLLNVVRHHGGA